MGQARSIRGGRGARGGGGPGVTRPSSGACPTPPRGRPPGVARGGAKGILLLMILGLPVIALAQAPPGAPLARSLPPAATPGGALGGALGGGRLSAPEGATPEERTRALLDIPPLPERPLDTDDGPRVFVRRFVLKGVESAPGVDPEALRQLVESLRQRLEGIGDEDPRGFRAEELEAIGAFLARVVARPDGDPDLEGYQRLVARLRSARRARRAGLGIGQLQQVADAVTRYYRERGYVLAQAYVPAQEVEDGVVRLEVLPGKLGRVLAEGNERYSGALLARPFEALIDAPVTAQGLESAILAVSEYPGLSAFSVLQPGREVGAADLVLRVQEERRFEGGLRVDNHGTRFTGDNRALADLAWNNPTGAADRLSGSFVKQFEPRNSILWALRYQRPTWPGGPTASLRLERNLFDVGAEFEELGFSGDTRIAELSLGQAFLRSRRLNLRGELGIRRTSSFTKVNGAITNEDHLAAIDARVSFDHIDPDTRAINQGELGVVAGLGDVLGGMTNTDPRQETPPSRAARDGEPATNRFYKVVAGFSRLQTLTPTQSLLFRTRAQFSPSLLTSTEQLQIGGPANLRAFPVSEFQMDSAVFASLEWIVNAPFFAERKAFRGLRWGDVLRVSFFTDFAWGDLNEPTQRDIDDNVDRFLLGGYGVGLQLRVPGIVDASLQAARPFGARDASDGDDIQYWLDLSYRF